MIFQDILFQLLFPTGIILLSLILGVIYLWVGKKQKVGKFYVTLGTAILFLGSNFYFSNLLLQTLESQYQPYSSDGDSVKSASQNDTIKYIVVLGAGHISNSALPLTSQISSTSLVRLAEGIKIYRQTQGSRMVLSGGKVFDERPISQILKEVALELGVPAQDLILEQTSTDTYTQARYVKSIVKGAPFVLVTSASHMPRAMAIFKKLGMLPVPAPTGYLSRAKHHMKINAYSQILANFVKTETAYYEYLSYFWAKLKKQL